MAELPEGFVLDDAPGLPDGFVLDAEDVPEVAQAPAAPPDTSFGSALLSGLAQPVQAIGKTAEILGAERFGRALQSVPSPENYQPAAESFINPPEGSFTIGGLAPRYLPRAIVEQIGQVGGSIASRVGGASMGAAIGGAAGSAFPGAGTAAGAVSGGAVGAFAGPFLFESAQIIGPIAEERARRNGYDKPTTEDLSWAWGTAAASGALNALGAKYLPGGGKAVGGVVKNVLKAFAGEGATEGLQSVAEQVGGTADTRPGLEVSPRQAIGEAILGGSAGAGVSLAAEAPGMLRRQAPQGPTFQQSEDGTFIAPNGTPLGRTAEEAQQAWARATPEERAAWSEPAQQLVQAPAAEANIAAQVWASPRGQDGRPVANPQLAQLIASYAAPGMSADAAVDLIDQVPDAELRNVSPAYAALRKTLPEERVKMLMKADAADVAQTLYGAAAQQVAGEVDPEAAREAELSGLIKSAQNPKVRKTLQAELEAIRKGRQDRAAADEFERLASQTQDPELQKTLLDKAKKLRPKTAQKTPGIEVGVGEDVTLSDAREAPIETPSTEGIEVGVGEDVTLSGAREAPIETPSTEGIEVGVGEDVTLSGAREAPIETVSTEGIEVGVALPEGFVLDSNEGLDDEPSVTGLYARELTPDIIDLESQPDAESTGMAGGRGGESGDLALRGRADPDRTLPPGMPEQARGGDAAAPAAGVEPAVPVRAGKPEQARALTAEDAAGRLAEAFGTKVKARKVKKGAQQQSEPEVDFSLPDNTFYSALTRTVSQAKQPRAPAAQWKGWLQNQPGVKRDEVEWSGVEQWLDEQKGPVTREQVADYLRQNEVQVQEVVLGGAGGVSEGLGRYLSGGQPQGAAGWMDVSSRLERAAQEAQAAGSHSEADRLFGLSEEAGRLAENLETPSGVAAGATKYSQYQTPGGENYRELLLTLPGKSPIIEQTDPDLGTVYAVETPRGTFKYTTRDAAERAASTEGRASFRSSHFDQTNILAHVRFNERTDAEGRRVLFIEEVQSDWHQKGRREGYGRAPSKPVQLGEGVPDAPFKQSWPLLTMKRMIRWAAENGFDRIAWTTGEQQAARYDLSKQISELHYWRDEDGDYGISAYDTDGRAVLDQRTFKESELEGAVGKEVSERIVNGEGEQSDIPGAADTVKVLRGDDLKIGGEGMKAFYDRELVNEVNKYVKKWGARVGRARLPGADQGRVDRMYREGYTEAEIRKKLGTLDEIMPAHSIDVTPQMRDAAMAGQPMFRSGLDTLDGGGEVALSTTADLRTALEQKFGKTGIANLIEPGLLNIVRSMSDLPSHILEAIERAGPAHTPKALYFRGNSAHPPQVFIIADSVSVDEVSGVLLHEIGEHHGLKSMLGEQGYSKLLDDVRRNKDSDKAISEAWARVAHGYTHLKEGSDQFVREVIAHVGERADAMQIGWFKSLVNKVRAFLWKLGLIRANTDDIRQMVVRSLRQVMSDAQVSVYSGDADSRGTFDTNEPRIDFSLESPIDRDFKAENARIRGEDKTLWDKAKTLTQRMISPRGLLPSDVFDENRFRERNLRVVDFDVRAKVALLERAVKADYGKSVDALDERTQKTLSDALAGKVDKAIPERTRTAIYAMRQHIDGMSTEYAQILEQQLRQKLEADEDADPTLLNTILGNVGSYVNRSYRAFDDKNWFKKVSEPTINAARKYLVDGYMERGMSRAEALKRAEQVLHEMQTGTAADSLESFIKESKLGAKDLSVLMRRTQIGPELRAYLGEYVDPRIQFAKSATKMGRLVQNQRFLDRVREIGMGAFLWEQDDPNRPPEARMPLAAEGSEVYAPLNGLYTTPEIEQAFRDAMGRENYGDMLNFIIRLNGAVKYGKTVLSPTTAMRNFQSAMFFALANGHFDMRRMADAYQLVKARFGDENSASGVKKALGLSGGKQAQDYVRHLIELGVVGDGANANEVTRLVRDSNLESLMDRAGKAGKTFKKASELAQSFYRFGDDFWKVIGFEQEKKLWIESGMSEAEAERKAAERIIQTYPTYSMQGKLVRNLSRIPIVASFPTFTAEIIRTSINMARYTAQDLRSDNPAIRKMGIKRAVGMAFVSGLFYGLSALTRSWLGVDDDEEEAVRELAPPWQKNSTFMYVGRDEDGNLQYFDMTFLDAYGWWKRPLTAMMRNKPWREELASGLVDLFSPFLSEDIAFGAFTELIANQKASGGRIYDPKDDYTDQAQDAADHLRKALQPGLVGNVERTLKAFQGRSTPSGKKYDPGDEMLSWLGWRASTLDPRNALYYRAYDFTDGLRSAKGGLTRVLRDVNPVSDSEIEDAVETSMRKRTESFGDMRNIVAAARKSGLSNADAARILKSNSVSQENIRALLSEGPIPRLEIDNSEIVEASRALRARRDDTEAVRELQRRYRLARKILADTSRP